MEGSRRSESNVGGATDPDLSLGSGFGPAGQPWGLGLGIGAPAPARPPAPWPPRRSVVPRCCCCSAPCSWPGCRCRCRFPSVSARAPGDRVLGRLGCRSHLFTSRGPRFPSHKGSRGMEGRPWSGAAPWKPGAPAAGRQQGCWVQRALGVLASEGAAPAEQRCPPPRGLRGPASGNRCGSQWPWLLRRELVLPASQPPRLGLAHPVLQAGRGRGEGGAVLRALSPQTPTN